MNSSDVYCRAASILVLRPADTEGEYEFLLLHKPRKNDSWQLPQGGIEDNETVAEAALRELEEEAGMTLHSIVHESEMFYQYDFPESYRRFRPDNVCGQRIVFVSALAERNVEIRVDDDEIDDFIWVTLTSMNDYIRRPEYRDLITTLYEEALTFLSTTHAH